MQLRETRTLGQLLAIDAEGGEDVDTSLLGTDFMFYTAFFGEQTIIYVYDCHV